MNTSHSSCQSDTGTFPAANARNQLAFQNTVDVSSDAAATSEDERPRGDLTEHATRNVVAEPTEQRVAKLLDELQDLADELNEADRYDSPQNDSTQNDSTASTPSYSYPADFLLSVVVPVYNEQETIQKMLARLTALPIPKEILIIDDGSTDQTQPLLMKLGLHPDLRLFFKCRNEGKGAAVRTGFQRARGDVVLVQDADLEYDPRDIPRLLQPILAGEADVVYGSRFAENRHCGSSGMHRLGNRALTLASNLATGLRLTDMETCYKVFRRDALRDVTIRQDRFGFEPEITAKIARRGFRLKELPVRYNARSWNAGKKIGWKDALEAIYCIARYAIGD